MRKRARSRSAGRAAEIGQARSGVVVGIARLIIPHGSLTEQRCLGTSPRGRVTIALSATIETSSHARTTR